MVNWNDPIDYDALSGGFIDADDLNDISENLAFLKSRPYNEASITTQTTTSASFVQVTNASASLTSYGGNMLIIANGKCSNSALGNNMFFDLAIDGTRVGNATNGLTIVTAPAANYLDALEVVWFTSTPPSATSHTYSVHWKTSGGTASTLLRLYVCEFR